MARNTNQCHCLVPLSDLFADKGHRDAAVEREGWAVSLDHLDRPAIPVADAQAFAAKRRAEVEQLAAEKRKAAQAEAERVEKLRAQVQGLFDEGFERSKQPDYSRRVEDARRYAAGRIYGKLSVEDLTKVTVVTTSRGEPVGLDDFPWETPPPGGGPMWKEIFSGNKSQEVGV